MQGLIRGKRKSQIHHGIKIPCFLRSLLSKSLSCTSQLPWVPYIYTSKGNSKPLTALLSKLGLCSCTCHILSKVVTTVFLLLPSVIVYSSIYLPSFSTRVLPLTCLGHTQKCSLPFCYWLSLTCFHNYHKAWGILIHTILPHLHQ